MYWKNSYNMFRNHFKREIKVLKTDNSREYINEPFNKFTKARGIKHQTSIPYNPEQNGKSERNIQTINEMIRSMIYGRNLSKYLWSETVNMAAYILNRSATNKSNKSPFERWFNKKPVWSMRIYRVNSDTNLIQRLKNWYSLATKEIQITTGCSIKKYTKLRLQQAQDQMKMRSTTRPRSQWKMRMNSVYSSV